jgi:hypothetical protein
VGDGSETVLERHGSDSPRHTSTALAQHQVAHDSLSLRLDEVKQHASKAHLWKTVTRFSAAPGTSKLVLQTTCHESLSAPCEAKKCNRSRPQQMLP